MDKQKIYKAAIEKFGVNNQIEMIQEECYELCHAIQKQKRFDSVETRNHVCEEFADVEIMLDQLDLIFKKKHVLVLSQYNRDETKHLCELIPVSDVVKMEGSRLTIGLIEYKNFETLGNKNRAYKHRQKLQIALELLRLDCDSYMIDYYKSRKLERLEQRIKA